MSRDKVDLSPPEEVRWIVRRLEEASFSTWAVGGAVRDRLAGLPAGDWDLATAARPADVQRLFRRTVPVGLDHGTVGVLGRDRRLYELTTFRRDVETFGRHAVVAFADRLDEDLERRDFTINAVAWHPITGEVHDPHGGRADLERRVLRTVGDPVDRFAEDRLRILRALRFAGRFSLEIDPETWRALTAATRHLSELSAERIREELMKLLTELRIPSVSLRLYADSGALRELYPELQACVGATDRGRADVWTHLLAATDHISRRRPRLRLAALLHDIGKPGTRVQDGQGARFPEHAAVGGALTRNLLRRLKASNADTDFVVHLVVHHEALPGPDAEPSTARRWAARVGQEFVRDLFRLRLADLCARGETASARVRSAMKAYSTCKRVLSSRPPLTLAELAIGGAELRALGLKPGPEFGDILRALLDRVLDDPALNSREELERIVRDELLPPGS